MSPDYRIIFFVLSLVAAAPVLYYYYRRHPNPRFRPRIGEMALVSLITIFVCGGASYFVGGLLQNPEDIHVGEGFGAPVLDDGNLNPSGSGRVSDQNEEKRSDPRRYPRSYDKPSKADFEEPKKRR
jgi:hypothetical protein